MQVQAAVMLQPGQIEIREFEKPTPADDSLLLQVDKVGICRLEMVQQMGADVVINVEKTTVEERVEQIQTLTNGVGVDIAIECAGIPAVFAEALDVVRRGGKVIEVGHYTD